MLYPRLLRTDPEQVARNLARRGFELDVARVRALEERRKTMQVAADEVRAARNAHAKLVGRAKAQGQDIATLVAEEQPAPDVLAAVVEEVGRVLRVDDTRIVRLEHDGTVTVVASWGVVAADIPVGTRWAATGDNVVTQVLRSGRPVRVHAADDPSGPIGDALACTKFVAQNQADMGYPSPGVLTASIDSKIEVKSIWDMISAPITVCAFICSNSSSVSLPALRRTRSSTPILPTSWSRAPIQILCWTSSGRPR